MTDTAHIDLEALEQDVDRLAATPAGAPLPEDVGTVVERLLEALELGAVRAAVRPAGGTWRAVPWV
jgi:hypothetical protein